MTTVGGLPRHDWWRAVPVGSDTTAPASARRSALAFWAMMYFLFSLLIAPQTFVPGLEALRLAAVAVAVAIVAHVVTALRDGQSIFPAHRSVTYAALLAGWALLTAPFSHWPGGTVELLFGLYFKSLVVFWLLGAVIDTGARFKQIAVWLTLLTVPIGATAVRHFLHGVFVAGGSSSAPRIEGYDAPLTANPNDLALVLCMMLPLAGALAAAQARWLPRLAFAAIAALDVAAIVSTFSRAGFLTLAALGLALVTRLPRRRAALCLVGVAGLALVLLPFLPGGYLEHMGTIAAIDSDQTGSAQNRWSDMLSSVALVAGNPIVGAGAGMSALALNEARGAEWVGVHNVYLEYATDLGLPGLALFLLMFAACLRTTNRIIREMSAGAPRDLRCIAIGTQLMLVAFAVAGFFHPVAYHFHFYYAGGLAIALMVTWENERASLTSNPRVRKFGGDRWYRAPVRESRARHRSGGVPSARRRPLLPRGAAEGDR